MVSAGKRGCDGHVQQHSDADGGSRWRGCDRLLCKDIWVSHCGACADAAAFGRGRCVACGSGSGGDGSTACTVSDGTNHGETVYVELLLE